MGFFIRKFVEIRQKLGVKLKITCFAYVIFLNGIISLGFFTLEILDLGHSMKWTRGLSSE